MIKKVYKHNIKKMVYFELIFKLLTFIILTPLINHIIKLLMNKTNYSYLSMENLFSFLSCPYPLITTIILLLFFSLYTIFDISVIIIIIDATYNNIKISIKDVLKKSSQKFINIFKYHNIPFILLIFIIFPILNIVLFILLLFITSPKNIIITLLTNKIIFLLPILLVILFYISIRWIYTFHYYVLENKSYTNSIIKSSHLGYKKRIKDFITITASQAFIIFGLIIVSFIITLLIIGIYYLFKNVFILNSIIRNVLWIFITCFSILIILVSPIISFITISILFYQHKQESKEDIIHIKIKNNNKHSLLTCSFTIISIILTICYINRLYIGKDKLSINIFNKTKITAHRGSSINKPENTFSSFFEAKKLNSDYIELDVRKTLDNVLVVIHDSNLKRIAYNKQKINSLMFDELRSIDVGSHLNSKYSYERIPTLESVIKWASINNIKLNIEAKPMEDDINFEKDIIDLINKYHFKNWSMISSNDYNLLRRCKLYDKDIKTVYITGPLFDITNYKEVDAFSIKQIFINKELVDNIHKENKEIYAWTVNNNVDANDLIDLNVDNIITDDVSLVKNILNKKNKSNIIEDYITFINTLMIDN